MKILTILLVIVLCVGTSGCGPHRQGVHSEESLPVEIDYEYSEWADAIRLSNPYWADERTLGWLEMHYFMQEEHRPHPDVRVVYWKVEQDVETLERTETLYHVSAIDRRWSDMLGFRYSEGMFVRIGSRHYSDLILQGGWRRMSPGNDLNSTRETIRHLPMDFSQGYYLYAQPYRLENTSPYASDRNLGIQLFVAKVGRVDESVIWQGDPVSPHNIDLIRIRDSRGSFMMARLQWTENIFLHEPHFRPDGVANELRFFRLNVTSGDFQYLGAVRTNTGARWGWDILPGPERTLVAMGHSSVRLEDGRSSSFGTIVGELGSEVTLTLDGGGLAWFPKMEAPVFSPDGKRIAGRTQLMWRTRYPDADDRADILDFMERRNTEILGHAVYEIDS